MARVGRRRGGAGRTVVLAWAGAIAEAGLGPPSDPFVLTNFKSGDGVEAIADFIIETGGLDRL
jgi:hypothetical protein